MAGKPFIERGMFEDSLPERYAGSDITTIYGDLSRLVVGMAARTDPAELKRMYLAAGWKGEPNVKAIHDAAKAWMEAYRPPSV